MGWECCCVVGFDLGPLLQGRTRILHLQYFFKYVLTYFLHLNSYLVTFLHNAIAGHNLLVLFFCQLQNFFPTCCSITIYSTSVQHFPLIIMLSSHYYLHKSKTLSQLTQCPIPGTLFLLLAAVRC